MRNGVLGSIASLFAGAGLALAQAPLPPAPAVPMAPGMAQPGWGGYYPAPYLPLQSFAPDASCAPACPEAAPCEPPPKHCECFWVSGDYLLWRVKNGPIIPLATSGASEGGEMGGILGSPGTQVLIGSSNFDFKEFSGGRLTSGFWFDPERPCCGLEGSGFFLERRSASFAANSNGMGMPPISIPFIDSVSGAASAFPLAVPGTMAGGVNATAFSRLWGADADFIALLYTSPNFRMTMLAGFKYLDLEERLEITDQLSAVAGNTGSLSFNGTSLGAATTASETIFDSFRTRNQFYGGESGIRLEYRYGRGYGILTTRLGLGVVRQSLGVNGVSTATADVITPPTSLPGGFFAVPGNSGDFKKDVLAAEGEVDFKVGCVIYYGLSAFIGYDFLYLTDVARPGQQINRVVDLTQVPTSSMFSPGFQTAPPATDIRHSSFWAQGIELGFEWRY
jgi:hypothetical protein